MTRKNQSGVKMSFDHNARNTDRMGFNVPTSLHCERIAKYSEKTQYKIKRLNREFDEEVGRIPKSGRNKVTLPKFSWDN